VYRDAVEVSVTGMVVRVFQQETVGDEWIREVKRSWDGNRREKPCRSVDLTVPQTDTGRQVEDTKAFEITIVKELGNLTP
jgi:hypothetical protein